MSVKNNINLALFREKADAALGMYLNTKAVEIQNSMRSDAPWTDRTGQARQRLTANSEKTDSGYRVTLSHGVDYGVWLELAHEKNYAILEPTLKRKAPEVIKGANKLISKI